MTNLKEHALSVVRSPIKLMSAVGTIFVLFVLISAANSPPFGHTGQADSIHYPWLERPLPPRPAPYWPYDEVIPQAIFYWPRGCDQCESLAQDFLSATADSGLSARVITISHTVNNPAILEDKQQVLINYIGRQRRQGLTVFYLDEREIGRIEGFSADLVGFDDFLGGLRR